MISHWCMSCFKTIWPWQTETPLRDWFRQWPCYHDTCWAAFKQSHEIR